ncbi:hypothetical protein BDQ12DRAFT_644218 [Crucibulum laeve]|uniref:Condensation domain-containing protein n=1 Tax=Crucibulum laeve TaxID=68775 RepID=A0A5C3MB22_9AGAR|nr:hypothetical protein BDQ12DRAFT_644218 [Crucibulum laeve]
MSSWTKSTWKPRPDSQPNNACFERALGPLETSFYWDSVFNRTADTLRMAEFALTEESNRGFSAVKKDIERSWISLKHEFPLLGATLEERNGSSEVFFTVSEERLRTCISEEIDSRTVESAEEARAIVEVMVNGPPILSNNLLARVSVFHRKDQPSHYYLVLLVAHIITDGMANTTILRTFLDRMSSMPEGLRWDMKERLALASPVEDLDPLQHLSIATRRWRLAIGRTIATNRFKKLSGGHTLPRKITPRTPFTPAYSGSTAVMFSVEQSSNIIRNCRKYNLTFGNVYPVLAHVALARLLCRRFISGEMSSEEWEYRKREPLMTAGPLNLRPFLDPEWFKRGGSGSPLVAISFFYYTLPFMPLGSASSIAPGDSLPDFDKFMSLGRLVLRSHMIKQQATSLMKHPLFSEITSTRLLANEEKTARIKKWQAGGIPEDLSDQPLSALEQGKRGVVASHGGSSFGNVDLFVPLNYPLKNKKGDSTLRLVSSETFLRCRPTELYLGAATSQRKLRIHVFWDVNVFEGAIVKEWLEEVGKAIEFYLGQDDSRQACL